VLFLYPVVVVLLLQGGTVKITDRAKLDPLGLRDLLVK